MAHRSTLQSSSKNRIVFARVVAIPTRDSADCSHDDRRLCHFEKKSFKIGHRITPIPWWN